LPELYKIQEYFESQHDLRFYSSSLLFLFEGLDNGDIKVGVRMIDFAHVHEIQDKGKDEGYLIGIRNLIKSFEELSK